MTIIILMIYHETDELKEDDFFFNQGVTEALCRRKADTEANFPNPRQQG